MSTFAHLRNRLMEPDACVELEDTIPANEFHLTLPQAAAANLRFTRIGSTARPREPLLAATGERSRSISDRLSGVGRSDLDNYMFLLLFVSICGKNVERLPARRALKFPESPVGLRRVEAHGNGQEDAERAVFVSLVIDETPLQ